MHSIDFNKQIKSRRSSFQGNPPRWDRRWVSNCREYHPDGSERRSPRLPWERREDIPPTHHKPQQRIAHSMEEEHYAYRWRHQDTRTLNVSKHNNQNGLRTYGSGCAIFSYSFSPASKRALASLIVSRYQLLIYGEFGSKLALSRNLFLSSVAFSMKISRSVLQDIKHFRLCL